MRYNIKVTIYFFNFHFHSYIANTSARSSKLNKSMCALMIGHDGLFFEINVREINSNFGKEARN